jgi:hypothetical protein
VIVFIIFQFLKPPHCASPVSMLDFDMLPINAHPTVSKFWYRVDPAYSSTRELKLRLEEIENGPVTIDETDNNNKVLASCSIIVHIANDFAPIIEKYRWFKLYTRYLIENEDEFHLDFKPAVPENGLKARSPECFFNEGHSVEQFIAISPHQRKLMYGIPYPALELGGIEDYDGARMGERAANYFFMMPAMRSGLTIQPALADNSVRPFAELKARLQSTNDVVMVEARRYLEANFNSYETDVLKELFETKLASGDYLASLVSGLISGIDRAGDPPGVFSPGRARDLSLQLPYISGQQKTIVAFNDDESDAVKQQARRLISRFPVDEFLPIYMKSMGDASSNICEVSGFDANQEGIIYSGIFFCYNRIIQLNYNKPSLAESDVNEIDKTAAMVHSAAKNCLSPDLAVDAALVDFGRAIVYSEDQGGKHVANAKAAARDFLNAINGQENSYFLPSHIALMRKLV